jgi:predicted RNase H-like nuclease (RuvC/YqgF family)
MEQNVSRIEQEKQDLEDKNQNLEQQGNNSERNSLSAMTANDMEVQSLNDEIKTLKFLNLKLKLQCDSFEKDAKITHSVVPELSAKIKKLKVLQAENDKLKHQIKKSNRQFKDESSWRSAEVDGRVQALEQEI